MYQELMKILNEIEVDDKTYYKMTMQDVKDYCVKVIELANENVSYERIPVIEREQLLNANVKLMDKYKETFEDLKVLSDFLDGDTTNKHLIFPILKKYRDRRTPTKEDYE